MGQLLKFVGVIAVCKTLEETLCLGYALEGLPVTIVRYFNIYGPKSERLVHMQG